MRHLVCMSVLVVSLMSVAKANPIKESYQLDLEWGAVWQDHNDVQSPNSAAGTRFPLDQLTGDGPYSAPRVQFTLPLNPRDDLRLIAAPLRLNERGTLGAPVNFEGSGFAAGAASATYRFDSYRATWRRTINASQDWILKAGLTGKIRDAEISISQGATQATRSDTGFVPLLHFYAQRNLGERSRLIFDVDGLASSRGRAFDFSLRYAHDLRPGLSAFGGIRILDGGADNDSVYNFARFHYLTVGLSFRGI